MTKKTGQFYELSFDEKTEILSVKFGAIAASNDSIVKEVDELLDESFKENLHGAVLKVNGAASLPVAMKIAHEVGHLAKCVACYDPKLAKYVVAISHHPDYPIGSLLD